MQFPTRIEFVPFAEPSSGYYGYLRLWFGEAFFAFKLADRSYLIPTLPLTSLHWELADVPTDDGESFAILEDGGVYIRIKTDNEFIRSLIFGANDLYCYRLVRSNGLILRGELPLPKNRVNFVIGEFTVLVDCTNPDGIEVGENMCQVCIRCGNAIEQSAEVLYVSE